MEKGKPGSSLRVVLDTNVYLSAFLFAESPLFRLWEGAVYREYTLLVSPAILRELARVLKFRFSVLEEEVITLLKRIVRVAELVEPRHVPHVVDDADDNHILACALSGKASLIVSGDKDLLRLSEFRGIPIIRPMDFVRTLGADSSRRKWR